MGGTRSGSSWEGRDPRDQRTPRHPPTRLCQGLGAEFPRQCPPGWHGSVRGRLPQTPRGERGCAHLQGLHQALHLARLQLRGDGPDEDTHGHVVHGRDVLRVDAAVPGLGHGCCQDLASSFLLSTQPSLPLRPEQHSTQPGPSASSRPGHRHRHRHRPAVLQSHSEGAGQAAGTGASTSWPAARSSLPR